LEKLGDVNIKEVEFDGVEQVGVGGGDGIIVNMAITCGFIKAKEFLGK
jgi:hypothetical protein